MKFLVVEDEENVRKATVRMLRRMYGDADVEVAADADTAIALLCGSAREEWFDAVVCDFNLLGGSTGAQVLSWIVQNMPRLKSRFLFLTDDDDAKKIHSNVLEKPAGLVDFRAAIVRTVAGVLPAPAK